MGFTENVVQIGNLIVSRNRTQIEKIEKKKQVTNYRVFDLCFDDQNKNGSKRLLALRMTLKTKINLVWEKKKLEIDM